MLNLPPHTAKLTHLNLREETHGGEKRKALDLSLEVVFSADTIDEMVPGAKIAFWKPPELPPAATALGQVAAAMGEAYERLIRDAKRA